MPRCEVVGLFYKRVDGNRRNVEPLLEQDTAEDIANKISKDIRYWHDVEVSICEIAHFSGLQHAMHARGAFVSWSIE